eukprot:GHUV01017473.1.p1 GENE.GHUV01017473.1~~GHUV01017473.1.p1  ORF type:complete len:364 (+),score=64.02 GHUV01017473.1:119-1210(+)
MALAAFAPRSACASWTKTAVSLQQARNPFCSRTGSSKRTGCGRRYITARSASGENTPAPNTQTGFLTSPEQQVPAFAALAVVHLGLATATTLVPGWSLQHLLGLHPLAPPAGNAVVAEAAARGMLVVAGAYLWLMAACLHCLKDAAAHNRLNSDTYKRLALGVMYQSVVAAVLFVRNKGLFTVNTLGTAAGVLLLTAVIVGRVYAVTQGRFALPTIVQSFAGNVRDLFKPQSISSAFYAACALGALLLFFWQFPSPGTPLFLVDCGPAAVFGKQARGAGMVLAGVVWYTLKDAADRGRLAASTFRELNLAMAVVAALQLWAYWQISVAGVPLNQGLWKGLIGTGLVTLTVCCYQFLFASIKDK